MVKFFVDMGIENLSRGLINKFWEAGFTTIAHYLKASTDDFLKLPGVQQKLAEKLEDNIQSHIKDVLITRVMAASNVFSHGIGERILEPLFLAKPDVFLHPDRYNHESIIKNIEGMDGVQWKTADKIAQGVPKFHKFMADHPEITVVLPSKKSSKLPLTDQVICITGFRDKDLQSLIEDLGGDVSSSVSKRTTILIAKDAESTSGKTQQARDLGVKIMTKSQFDAFLAKLR